MLAGAEPSPRAKYNAALRDYRLRFSSGGAYTGIGLVLLGVGLDYNLYPGLQLPFALARLACAALMLGIVLLMRSAWGRRRVPGLTFLWLLLPQIMIAAMIYRTEGANSIYYAGLNLAVFASAIALPFSMWQNVALGALSYLSYALACYLHPGGFAWSGPFAVNSLFLVFTAIASAVCAFYNEQARFMLFQLKAEVAEKNSQLERTNKSLSDIKGQMLQQEKMVALGTLAAGLLHEVNNPVNFCLMAIDVAIEVPEAQDNALLADCLKDAKEGMQRVQHIVSDLKTFAYRKSDAEAQGAHFLFEKALAAAIRLIGYELKDVEVRCDLPPDTLVCGDEAAIVGVLINLLGNAVLALRQGGAAPYRIGVAALWTGARLRVTVRDNGPGIAPQHLARVFEPFFTTREVGQGLGLGLSISYGVIERHGGALRAESVVGEWTQMSFDLPRPDWDGDAHPNMTRTQRPEHD
ncbi:sensor histidine kinase [Janthinobacterium sp.]|uniref:sensor histidine kinase n=1 Tax=Janthinobacterium sp. TaxID=1871054 RepID=UPI00293D41C5|nr:ATP-binding protein [Janthinobacterium sp.]